MAWKGAWAWLLGAAVVALAGAEPEAQRRGATTLAECAARVETWLLQFEHVASGLQCFNASLPVATISHSLACAKPECTSGITDVHAAAAFNALCVAVEGYAAPKELALLEAVHADMGAMCNKCIQEYEAFKGFQATWQNSSCQHALGTRAICDSHCLGLARDLLDRWTVMLAGRLCQQYNQGGCGETGGMTEGAVYDALSAMFMTMQVYESLPHVCSAACGAKLAAWYGGWMPLLADGSAVSGGACIATSVAAASVDELAQATYDVSADCSDETCVARIRAVASEYNAFPLSCVAGITAIHNDKLLLAVHPSKCVAPAAWYTEWAIYAVVLAVAMFVLLVLYLGVGRCCCRRDKGGKGFSRKPLYALASTSDADDNPVFVADDKL